jgi:hypothetical protein
MKKVVVVSMLLVFAAVSVAQEVALKQTKEYYAVKSKKQKKTAKILLIGGAACVAIGFLIQKGEVTNPGFIFTTEYKNDGIKQAFVEGGILSMLGSIPFYLLSSKNKRKANAATVSINNQQVLFPQQNVFGFKTQPAVTFKLHL